jgi:Ca2+-binding EF-hand superfamily protein
VAQIQEAFCAVDLDKDGIIAAKDLESVLRFLGQNPSESELQVL